MAGARHRPLTHVVLIGQQWPLLSSRPERALGLYRGEFLAGFSLDVEPFDALFGNAYFWHEMVHMYLAAFLVGLGVVPAAALGGIVLGVLAIRRGGRIVGAASILANLPALIGCGFLFLFFALGGSR